MYFFTTTSNNALLRFSPDLGTVLRFFERDAPAGTPADDALPSPPLLPGLGPLDGAAAAAAVAFPPAACATGAYADHWVSNVHDRERFLVVLRDTLGFSPKVNFNAGVVAAGAAIIESTVAGNEPGLGPLRHEEAEVSQQQVIYNSNIILYD